jgi:nucleoid-associated protein YgaU
MNGLIDPGPEAPTITEIVQYIQRDADAQTPAEPEEPVATIDIGGPRDDELPVPDERETIDRIIREELPSQIWEPLGPAPSPSLPPTPAPAPRKQVTHVVKKGETLSSISDKYYQTRNKWRTIYQANKAQLPNPDVLPVGTRLKIPPADGSDGTQLAAAGSARPSLSTTTAAAGSARRTYTAAKGDTLWSIALKKYGDGSKSKDILNANRDKIQKARDLKAGMTLVLP